MSHLPNSVSYNLQFVDSTNIIFIDILLIICFSDAFNFVLNNLQDVNIKITRKKTLSYLTLLVIYRSFTFRSE